MFVISQDQELRKNIMVNLEKDISLLIEAGVIDQPTAIRIQQFYEKGKAEGSNRLFTIFAILGATLVGLGIILLVAHNWDELSKLTKVGFSFLPLLIGQLASFYAMKKRPESRGWAEGSAVFLFLAIGTSISLISQIYNIPGSIRLFLLSWLLIAAPLIYLLRSSMVNLLFIAGSTWFAWENVFENNNYTFPWLYLGLIGLTLPHYYQLFKLERGRNFRGFHNWFYPLSFTIILGSVGENNDEVLLFTYMNLFGLLYQIGQLSFFENARLRINGWKIIGSLGMVVILLLSSFHWFWEDLFLLSKNDLNIWISREMLSSFALMLITATIILFRFKRNNIRLFEIQDYLFLAFFLVFILGVLQAELAQLLCNLLLLALGLLLIKKGNRINHLGVLNYGLLILTALVVCRFFDTHLSFIIRGLLFIALGFGFFYANYHLLKKRKAREI